MLKSVIFGVAAVSFFSSAVGFAKTCDLEISGSDAMKYDKESLSVAKDCTEVKLVLKHSGKLGKDVMGHNWVLVAEKDEAAVVKASGKPGASIDKVLAADKTIVAHTKLVGGGESDTTTFKTSALKKGTKYVYVCTMPGHSSMMKGTFEIK